MSDEASEQPTDPAADDLDVGLRNRLRDARSGSEMTRQELLELAEALTRQRQEIARSLADLSRREEAAAGVRSELERASRDAAEALDERDARLGALAAELERERARLDQRERQIGAAAAAPAHGIPEALEGVLTELRDRLDRVEAALAERVRTVPETILGLAGTDERMARAVELVSELGHILRHPLEAVRGGGEEEAAPEPAPAPVAAAPPQPEPAAEATVPGHVLFVSTDAGYRVFEREGDAPADGERVAVGELDGADAVVTGLRASPFPGDRRRCLVCTLVPAEA